MSNDTPNRNLNTSLGNIIQVSSDDSETQNPIDPISYPCMNCKLECETDSDCILCDY